MLHLCTCRSHHQTMLLWTLVNFTPTPALFFHYCKQQSNRTRVTLPRPTYSTVSDERMTQLGDFVPRERDFPQEDLPTLNHDFFALGVVLQSTAMAAARLGSPPSRQHGRAGGLPPLPSTPGRWGWWSAGRAPRRRRRPPRSPPETGCRWRPAGCSSGPGWSPLRGGRGARSGQGWASPARASPWGETRGRGETSSRPGPRGDPGPPRSCLRKPSSTRMATTAEATSGSSLSCALKVSIRSARQPGAVRPGPARPGATPRHPPPAPIYRPCSWQRPLRSALLPARPPHRPPRLGVAPCRPSDGTRSDDVAPCRGVISRRREQLALPTGAMSAGEAAGSRAARRWREVGAAAGAQRASALGPAGLRPLRRPGSFRRRQERGRERGSGARPRRPRAAWVKLRQARGAARAARPAGSPCSRRGPGRALPGSSELPGSRASPAAREPSAGAARRFARSLEWRCCVVTFSDDELSLLVIVVDANPIWWGKKALGEAEVCLLGVGTSDGDFWGE